MALPVMMTSGRIRDYCTDQALRLGNWNEVLQAMQDRYEDGDLRRERENRWLLRGMAEFVEEKGSGLTLAEQAMGFFYEMEDTQSPLSQSNQTTRVLLDKLRLSYKNYPLMTQAVSRFLNVHMSPLQLATAVRDELVTAAIAQGQRRVVHIPPTLNKTYHGAFFVDDVDFAVDHLVVDRKCSSAAKRPSKGRACFICGNEGHFMNTHSKEERERHMEVWRAKRGNSDRGVRAYASEATDCQYGEQPASDEHLVCGHDYDEDVVMEYDDPDMATHKHPRMDR
ncbi:MAG: hypothetical protein SEPTF4163_001429 [Sporothrix epigloea]